MTDTLPIQLAVAAHYGISLVEMRSRDLGRSITWPRQVAMYFMRQRSRMTLTAIGRRFDRDHGTVMHSIQHVKDLMESDSVVRQDVQALEAKFNKYSGNSITSTGILKTGSGHLEK